MKPIEILYDIIKLNCNDIEICDYEYKDDMMTFIVKGKGKRGLCPCGKKTCKRKDRKEYLRCALKHIALSDGRLMMIKPVRRYFVCHSCGKCFMEKFRFEAEKGRHTIAFEQYVMAARGYMSGCEIGRQTKSSFSKIHSILHEIDPEILNKEGMKFMKETDEIFIGIDEHSFSGRDMVLVIVDIKELVPLAVLETNQMEEIKARFNSLPIEIKRKIKGIASDMHAGYIKNIESVIGRKLGVIDKYHLFQEANRMMDEVRQLNAHLIKNNMVDIDEYLKTGKIPKQVQENIEIKQGLKKATKYKEESQRILDPSTFTEADLINKAGRVIEFKEISLEYYLNCKGGYGSLFRKREKNLSGIQKLRLRQILREFDYNGYMSEAWIIKERFFEALDDKDAEEIDEIREEALISGHYRIRAFGRTLKRWKIQIANFCGFDTNHSCTNASTESYNNQCKIAKRVSHGFRHKKNYLKKIGTRLVRNTRKKRIELQN